MAQKRKFPVLWTLLLLFAISWILDEMNIISLDIPWIPTTLAIFAIGMIINRLRN